MYEPPARPDYYWYHWHFSRSPTDVLSLADLKSDGQRFISPILFVDGHTARHDFTRTIKGDPSFPFEPTKDWVWYKPRPVKRSERQAPQRGPDVP